MVRHVGRNHGEAALEIEYCYKADGPIYTLPEEARILEEEAAARGILKVDAPWAFK